MSFLDRRAGGAALALIMALGGCIDVDGIVYDLGEGGAGLGGWGVGGAIPEGGGGSGRSYFDVVMDDAPAGFWRFNEASSAEVLDSSGNDHHALSVLGDGTIERDVVGALFSNDPDAAIALSGGAYVILSPNPFDLSGLAPYTFEAWVDVAEATNPPHLFLWIEETPPDNSGMQTFLWADSAYHKRYDGAGGFEEISESPTVLSDGYHHLVITFDGANARIYIDGALVTDPDPPDFVLPIPSIGSAMILADTQTGTTLYLDELALYDHALDLTRVEAHYQCGANADCP
ncbi:MAG: LamG domain-containing protein [Polyangiaceae bacterium]|jgi:hypothetical protein|nr:LamG domain-containing protein [Polyangiaceae bacterium]